jgi:hypothetical protein
MKLNIILLLSLFFICHKYNCYLRKVKVKGDIPKFCTSAIAARTKPNERNDQHVNVTYVIAHQNNGNNSLSTIKTINSASYNDEDEKGNLSHSKNIHDGNFYMNLFYYFLGLYFYLLLLNFLKLLEEIYRNMIHYVKTRFSHFEDLTKLVNPDIEKFENKFIFTSGLLFFAEPACDPIFNFDYGKVYLKIERKIMIFSLDTKIWVDYENDQNFDVEEFIKNLKDKFEVLEEEWEVLRNIFQILKNQVFIGKATLRGVKVSEKHLKKLQNFEKINLSNNQCLEIFEKIIFGTANENRLSSKNEADEKDLILSITDNQTGKPTPIIKVSLLGVIINLN